MDFLENIVTSCNCNVKGECEMRLTNIKSLTDYFVKIKKYELSDCICRGECAKYESIQSGMFREKYPIKNSWLIQQYYNLVGNSLTELQKKHFTAFSQHYGLPTNLIDFTTSPLIALYFACQNKETSEKGYVHFIECNKLVDIGNDTSYINHLNFLEEVLSFSNGAFSATIDFVRRIYNLFLIEQNENIDPLLFAIDYYKKLAIENKKYNTLSKSFADFAKINLDVTYNNLSHQLNSLSSEILNEQQCIFLDCVFKHFEYDYTYLVDRILYFLIILKVVHEAFDPVWKWGIDILNLPFYIVYRPPLIVPRIENQSSIFIQQQYLSYDETSEYVFNPVIQKIKADRTLVILNKEEILCDLDNLGINEKFIFNDYDHIAH